MQWIMINDKIINWEKIIEFGLCGTECYYIQTPETVDHWRIDFQGCNNKQILMKYLAMLVKEIEREFEWKDVVDIESIDIDRDGLKKLSELTQN